MTPLPDFIDASRDLGRRAVLAAELISVFDFCRPIDRLQALLGPGEDGVEVARKLTFLVDRLRHAGFTLEPDAITKAAS
jgi:hypothetical protein